MIYFFSGGPQTCVILERLKRLFKRICLFNRKNYRFFLHLPNSSVFLQAGILYNVFPLHLHFFSVSFLVSINSSVHFQIRDMNSKLIYKM